MHNMRRDPLPDAARNEVMAVIQIAICDDEEKSVALHERIVKECLQAEGIGYAITTYTQSRNLLYDITDDGFFYEILWTRTQRADRETGC